MCLAVPGRILEVYQEEGLKMGRIDFAGTVNRACLDFVPEAGTGQYVIVHAGFAISMLNEEEAQESLKALKELAEIQEEENPPATNSSTRQDG